METSRADLHRECGDRHFDQLDATHAPAIGDGSGLSHDDLHVLRDRIGGCGIATEQDLGPCFTGHIDRWIGAWVDQLRLVGDDREGAGARRISFEQLLSTDERGRDLDRNDHLDGAFRRTVAIVANGGDRACDRCSRVDPERTMTEDRYRTLESGTQAVLREKASRFIAFAFPINDQDEFKRRVDAIAKEHHSSRHVCYAWVLGDNGDQQRSNDAGEPSGTAGKPILNRILGMQLTYTAV